MFLLKTGKFTIDFNIFKQLWLKLAVIALINISYLNADGLPGEYLLSARWRVLFGIHSPLNNPAFLTEESYLTCRSNLATTLENQFKFSEIGITLPIGLYQSFGFSWLGEFDPPVDAQNEFDPVTGQLINSGSTAKSQNSNLLFMGTWAYNPIGKLSIGVNGSFAMQSNFGDPVMGIGLDIGATYRIVNHSFLGYHLFGLSTVNLIAPTMSSSIVPKIGKQEEYAKNLRLSLVSSYMENRFGTQIDYELKDFLSSKKAFSSSPSATSLKELEWGLTFITKISLMKLVNAYGLIALQDIPKNDGTGELSAIDYWGLGLGMNLTSFTNGKDLELIYQLSEKIDASYSSAHSVYLRSNLGYHREEKYAQKMARFSNLSPNELYNRAMALYSEGNYWDAFFLFSRILNDFDDFFKNDWVSYYRTSCLEKLDMREFATQQYDMVALNYPQSLSIPHAKLGIMRIAYRQQDFDKVNVLFNELTQESIADSIKDHARYLMGQTFFQKNDLDNAKFTFDQISESHPEYAFAQHSKGIALILKDAPRDEIFETFKKVVDIVPNTNSQKEIVNRSYLIYGYLFYDEGALSKAVTALRLVDEKSVYFDDALLGLGWSAIKARQWNDCVDIGKKLSEHTKIEQVQLEALLIQGYGLFMQKQYGPAMSILEKARSKSKSVDQPNIDSLKIRESKYAATRLHYDQFSKSLENVSQKASTPQFTTIRDSMHIVQKSYKDSIDIHLLYKDDFKKLTIFSKSLDDVKSNIEYSHATLLKIINKSGDEKLKQQTKEQLNEIDEEIKKLHQEMEKSQ